MATNASLDVTKGGFYAGLVIGFGAGALYMACRLALKDATGARQKATAAQQFAWRRFADLIVLGFLLAVAAAYMLGNPEAAKFTP
jgi:hypothetical protein